MKVAFIGTGTVAMTLAPRLAAAGHSVVLGSRKATGQDMPLLVVSHAAAVMDADVVVNAVPGVESLECFAGIGAQALANKVVLDLANAILPGYELAYPGSSLAERLQKSLPHSHVVKSANTAAIRVVADPSTLNSPGNLFVSGDSQDAKDLVRMLLHDLGWSEDSIIDLGGVATARSAEHYFSLFWSLVRNRRNAAFNIAIVE